MKKPKKSISATAGQVLRCSTDGIDPEFPVSPRTFEDSLHAPKLSLAEARSGTSSIGIPRTIRLTDFQFFNFAVERRKADVQQLGRFLTIMPDLFERAEDMLFLELP